MNDTIARFDESGDETPVYEIVDDGTTLAEATEDAAQAVDSDETDK